MNKQLQNILHKPDITGNIEYLQKLENETYEKAYEYKTLKNELLISQRDLRGKYVRISKERSYNNAVYIHVYEQFVTCDKHDTRIYLNGLSFKYNDSSYLDDIWFEFDAHKQLSYNLNEFLNLTIIELSADEFKSNFGTLVPMTLEKLKVDPAIATGPFISITNDIIGMMLYMGITVLLS